MFITAPGCKLCSSFQILFVSVAKRGAVEQPTACSVKVVMRREHYAAAHWNTQLKHSVTKLPRKTVDASGLKKALSW